jgi:hypothetical protein
VYRHGAEWVHYQGRGDVRSLANRKGLGVLLRAILVESERVSGAPRQHHVAYLGSIADTKSALTGVTSGSAPSSGSTSSAAG